ncbi:MAG: 4-alpha-glucanotransferase [Acidobacteria bacterium]|nr:4-alpha-glucanotransferase [Acidobacteriota bacterium]
MPHMSIDPAREQRFAGVLLHPTSLPGRYGTGDLGDELIEFLDWAAAAGARVWQVLPLNPPGYGNSPYGCLSSFGGNPMLISPQRLLQDGWIGIDSVEEVPRFADDFVEFERVGRWKWGLLRQAWQNARAITGGDACPPPFAASERAWLDDFALFMALKERAGSAPWWEWSEGLATREPRAMAEARQELAGEIDFQQFVQWLFADQWKAVREAARARGIRILGDVPIYVAQDSADVWSNRALFQLDENGLPTVVAGVPPDYFSVTGQRWGNPLYRWDVLRETKYAWWIERIRANLKLADIIRLDHFRGFAAYWEIPAQEPTAIHGCWKPGPGRALFDAIREALGGLPLIAEDLGFITPEVHELRHAVKLPGMKILQFGFDEVDSPHLPHRYEPAAVVYTGTHDNDTARGWFEAAPPGEQALVRAYLGEECHDIAWSLIRTAYTSVAGMAIVPVQDILGLGSEARMNRPGNSHDNWSWRLLPGTLTAEHAERLRRLAEISGRV